MPKYEPDGSVPLSEFADTMAMRVSAMYQHVEAELVAEAKRLALRHIDDASLNAILRDVRKLEKKARQLVGKIPSDLAAQIAQAAVEQGTAYASTQLGIGAGLTSSSALTTTVASLAGVVAADLGNKMAAMEQRILRWPRDQFGNYLGTDIYQATVADTITSHLVGAKTLSQTRQVTLEKFLQQGVTSFTDIAGRRWTIGAYSEMAVRTASTRAFTDGTTWRILQAGIRTAYVVGTGATCKHCAPWVGKVLSLDGTPAGTYTVQSPFGGLVRQQIDGTLEEAQSDGLFHPNCTHQLGASLAGVPVPQSEPYKPEVYKATQKLRALERRERRLKLDLAAATTHERAKDLRVKIRETQADTRAHVKQWGLRRRYDRSQATFQLAA